MNCSFQCGWVFFVRIVPGQSRRQQILRTRKWLAESMFPAAAECWGKELYQKSKEVAAKEFGDSLLHCDQDTILHVTFSDSSKEQDIREKKTKTKCFGTNLEVAACDLYFVVEYLVSCEPLHLEGLSLCTCL